MAKRKKKSPPTRLPKLEECEKALGEKAEAWVARCYEISCRIVAAGLVKGVAVYGHWLGPVHPKSHFAGKPRPFVQHGWILTDDGEVLDPTRWVFEAAKPYLYVGTEPDDWSVTPCRDCGLLDEEHDDDGPPDHCGNYRPELWPYDEGGNQWREAMQVTKPPPVPKKGEERNAFKVSPDVAIFVAGLLGEGDGSKLTTAQIFWLANLPYTTFAKACGGRAVREVYEAICDASDEGYFIEFIPLDNRTKAKREAGFARS